MSGVMRRHNGYYVYMTSGASLCTLAICLPNRWRLLLRRQRTSFIGCYAAYICPEPLNDWPQWVGAKSFRERTVNWIKRKWQWAMRNKLFWWNIVLIAAAVAFIFIWRAPGESDFRIKTLGMILQLIGVGTVWFDLTNAARTFGKTGMIQRTKEWLKAGFTGDAAVLFSVASAQANATCSARATVRWPIDPNAVNSARIEALEKNLAKIDEDINALFQELDRHAAVARERVSNEENMRAQAVAEVRRELIEASVGNFPILVFGAVWLAVGVVLSTWAPEIAKITAGKWGGVWVAM